MAAKEEIMQLMRQSMEYSEKQDYDSSLPLITRLIELTKQKSALPLLSRCTCYIQLKRYEEAEKDALKIISLEDNELEAGIVKGCSTFHSAAYSRLHNIYCKLEKVEVASEMLKKRSVIEDAIKKKNLEKEKQNKEDKEESEETQKLKQILNDKGKRYVAKKNFKKGIEAFEQSVNLAEDEKTHSNLAACYLELKEWNKVLFHANQALIINPNFAKAWYRQGIALYQLKEYNEAIKAFEASLKLTPEDEKIETYLNLVKAKSKPSYSQLLLVNGTNLLLIIGCILALVYLLNLY